MSSLSMNRAAEFNQASGSSLEEYAESHFKSVFGKLITWVNTVDPDEENETFYAFYNKESTSPESSQARTIKSLYKALFSPDAIEYTAYFVRLENQTIADLKKLHNYDIHAAIIDKFHTGSERDNLQPVLRASMRFEAGRGKPYQKIASIFDSNKMGYESLPGPSTGPSLLIPAHGNLQIVIPETFPLEFQKSFKDWLQSVAPQFSARFERDQDDLFAQAVPSSVKDAEKSSSRFGQRFLGALGISPR